MTKDGKMPEGQYSEAEVARRWDENAEVWTHQVRQGWDVYRERYNNPAFFDFLGCVKGETVLDMGCGEGYNTRLLASRGASVVGVDVSVKMIESARREEQRHPLGIRYEVASFCELSMFREEAFDVVVSFMALMDGPDYEGAVAESFRVLRPGGHLVFSITHPCFMTRGFDWVRDSEGNARGLVISHYFDREPWLERWGFSGTPDSEEGGVFAVPAFPRTLSDYVNALMRTGFVLEELGEPRVSEGAVRLHPYMQGWRDHAPLFFYVRAAKPR